MSGTHRRKARSQQTTAPSRCLGQGELRGGAGRVPPTAAPPSGLTFITSHNKLAGPKLRVDRRGSPCDLVLLKCGMNRGLRGRTSGRRRSECLLSSDATEAALRPSRWPARTQGGSPFQNSRRNLSPRRGNHKQAPPWHSNPLSQSPQDAIQKQNRWRRPRVADKTALRNETRSDASPSFVTAHRLRRQTAARTGLPGCGWPGATAKAKKEATARTVSP